MPLLDANGIPNKPKRCGRLIGAHTQLRRIGMSEEGIELWSAYDETKQVMSTTTYGLTEPITPVAGAFGQGAEESPFGFVAFMSWLTILTH
jgi:hypothetical protein